MSTAAVQRFQAIIANAESVSGHAPLKGKQVRPALAELASCGVSQEDADVALDVLAKAVDSDGRKALLEFLGQRSYRPDRKHMSVAFDEKLQKALADGKISKQEAREMRRVSLGDLKSTGAPVSTSEGYKNTFMFMLGKADKVSTERYIADVSAEFHTKARYQRAARALRTFLIDNPTHPLAKKVDLTQPFEVGNTLNRSVWLDIAFKANADLSKTPEALMRLFETEPSLQKYGKIWIL